MSDMDKIEVCYEVVFKTESTEPEKIVNTAKARGDISPEIAAQQEVYVKTKAEPTATPTPVCNTETNRNTKADRDTKTYRSTKPTEQPKATPIPSVPGTCPKMTPVPTKAPLASTMVENNGGTTSGKRRQQLLQIRDGYSGGYGSYQGGSMAGSSKTGDVRPFKMMAVLGLIGMGLLTGGVVIYRRTVSGKRNIKGMPRK